MARALLIEPRFTSRIAGGFPAVPRFFGGYSEIVDVRGDYRAELGGTRERERLIDLLGDLELPGRGLVTFPFRVSWQVDGTAFRRQYRARMLPTRLGPATEAIYLTEGWTRLFRWYKRATGEEYPLARADSCFPTLL